MLAKTVRSVYLAQFNQWVYCAGEVYADHQYFGAENRSAMRQGKILID